MSRSFTITPALVALLTAAPVAAGARTQDQAPVALRSADELTRDSTKSESWTYVNPALMTSRFSSICISPPKVYEGADAQFGDTSPDDRARFAEILATAVQNELAKAFVVTNGRQPDCLSLQLTLVGVENTKEGLSTASHVLPVGLAFNTIKQLTGKPGSFTGSILVAVEMSGGKKNELLAAAVRRRAPEPLDVPATLSTSDSVKAASRDFGKALGERLLNANVIVAR